MKLVKLGERTRRVISPGLTKSCGGTDVVQKGSSFKTNVYIYIYVYQVYIFTYLCCLGPSSVFFFLKKSLIIKKRLIEGLSSEC